jgi:Ulp1 family protease
MRRIVMLPASHPSYRLTRIGTGLTTYAKCNGRWTHERTLGYQVVDCEHVLVPIHMPGHWVLVHMKMTEPRCMEWLDSMGGLGEDALDNMVSWVAGEYKLGKECWDRRNPSVPAQHNEYDCGVFMLCNIEALLGSRGSLASEISFEFSQSDIPAKRQTLKTEILAHGVDATGVQSDSEQAAEESSSQATSVRAQPTCPLQHVDSGV